MRGTIFIGMTLHNIPVIHMQVTGSISARPPDNGKKYSREIILFFPDALGRMQTCPQERQNYLKDFYRADNSNVSPEQKKLF
jgi:hypothetical protein